MATGGVKEVDILLDEIFDLLCSVCRAKNKNTEAAKFCVDCQDYYCSTCVKFHEDVPALSRHKILEKGQFQPGTSNGVQMVPTERCDRHNHKHIDISCKDTFYIPDFIQNNVDTSNPHAIRQELDSSTDILKDQYNKVQLQKERLLKSKAQSIKKVKEFKVEIKRRLDQLEQKSMVDIEEKYKTMLDKLDKHMDKIEKNKLKVSTAKDDLISAGNNVSQVFVSTKKGKIAADNALKYFDEIKGEIEREDQLCTPDRKLKSLFQELNRLGQLTESNTERDHQNQMATVVESAGNSSKKQTGKASQNDCKALIKVTGNKQYNIRIQTDKYKCNINSACILDDWTIILSDYGNSRLKRVDSSTYTVTDYCDVSGSLYQVCKISNKEVAVSCGGHTCIQFVSIGSKMVPTKQIKTNHRCFGLAYAAGHVYISDNTSVYIYTISGSRLQQFNKDQSGQGLFSNIYNLAVGLFNNIYSLAVSIDGSKIYVADADNGLIALGSNGKVLGKFNGPELTDVRSVCIMDNINVLVCGSISKNVLQFTLDCGKIGEVLKCDDRCQAVCYDPRQSKLIVGFEKVNNIAMYEVN